MPTPSFQGTQLLTIDDLYRIQAVTDGLQLHRDWLTVPIDIHPEGRVTQQPDGKIIIHAPGRDRFEAWIRALRGNLQALDLGRVPRSYIDDPNLGSTGPHAYRPMGTRSYLGPLGIVR